MNYDLISYLTFNSSRRFGVELEMGHNVSKLKIARAIESHSNKEIFCTGYKLSSNNNYWHIKDDSTCGVFGKNGPKGVEVASYVAQGVEDIEHISLVGRILHLNGCRTNQNCGYHIHAEVKDFDINNTGVLLAYWLKIEPWIENMIPYQRRNSKYCTPLYSLKSYDKLKSWKPQELFAFFSPKKLTTFENEERRVSLNLVNYVKYFLFPGSSNPRCTLELRLPEGTLDYVEIKNWIYFFLNFIDFCKNRDMPSDLLPCSSIDQFLQLSGLNHTDKVFYIFSKEIFEVRNWVLKRIAFNGTSFYKKGASKKISFLDETILDNK